METKKRPVLLVVTVSVGVATGKATSRARKNPGTDDLPFNIFFPTADWEIKPYREYKGKGLLEQIVSGADNLPF